MRPNSTEQLRFDKFFVTFILEFFSVKLKLYKAKVPNSAAESRNCLFSFEPTLDSLDNFQSRE